MAFHYTAYTAAVKKPVSQFEFRRILSVCVAAFSYRGLYFRFRQCSVMVFLFCALFFRFRFFTVPFALPLLTVQCDGVFRLPLALPSAKNPFLNSNFIEYCLFASPLFIVRLASPLATVQCDGVFIPRLVFPLSIFHCAPCAAVFGFFLCGLCCRFRLFLVRLVLPLTTV